MHEPRFSYGSWPLPRQEGLLRAALFNGPDARAAWAEWHHEAGTGPIDEGSRRLLPLVLRHVTRHTPNVPGLERVRQVYKREWMLNHSIRGRLAAVLRDLHAAGIETIVLRGVPLGLHYYKDLGLRPMAGADVLVHPSQAAQALAVVAAAGLESRDDREPWPPRFTESHRFAGADGFELDLHCHVLHECLHDADDDDFWAAARPLRIAGVETRRLCAADQLLHSLAHGSRRSVVPRIQWIADAAMVIRASGGELDWDRLIEQARDRQLSLIAANGLRYLTKFQVSVPGEAMETLEAVPASTTERLERWARSGEGALRVSAETWCEYARAASRDPHWRGPIGLLHYAQDRLGVASAWEVPSAAVATLRLRMDNVPAGADAREA